MTSRDVVLYTTSVSSSAKVKSDISRVKAMLDSKNVRYVEVDIATSVDKREAMLAASNGERQLPQIHVDGKFAAAGDHIQELEDFGDLNALLGQ